MDSRLGSIVSDIFSRVHRCVSIEMLANQHFSLGSLNWLHELFSSPPETQLHVAVCKESAKVAVSLRRDESPSVKFCIDWIFDRTVHRRIPLDPT